MKKLMMVLGVVAMATAVQAGTFKWSTSMGNYLFAHNSTDKLTTAYTAYLFDANSVSQEKLLSDFRGSSGINFSSAMDNTSVSSTGTIAAKSIDVTPSQNFAMYIVIVDGDNVYISPEKGAAGPGDGKTTTVQFATSASSKLAPVATAYAGAGWYTVPEPTSGLLLILGMAGLALKRKRA